MNAVAEVLVVVGAVLVLLAAVALHRFGAVMTRLHAAGKASSLGVAATFGAVALRQRDVTSLRLVLAAGLYLVTVAAAVSLLARVVHVAESDERPPTDDQTSRNLT